MVRVLLLFLGVVMTIIPISKVRAAEAKSTASNPLLAPWTGDHGGLPPFDQVKVSQFKPAIEQSMAQTRQEIDAIANDTNPPTFDNVMVAMERTGQTFNRVMAIYGVWSSAMSTPEFQKIEQQMAPKLSAFSDETFQNGKLFTRIEAVYNSPEKSKWTPEQQRLAWTYYTNFVQHGARLNAEQKKRVSAINQKIATLSTKFSQNQLGDEEKDFLLISKKSDLEGLPQWLIDSAASEAQRRSAKDSRLKNKWVIANTRSSMEPFFTFSAKRKLREKAYKIWASRGDNNNARNNNKIASEILQLRAERSKLYGYPTYAHWHLADTMAKDPQATMDLMMKVWKPAAEAVKKDVAEMQALVDAEKGNFKIEPWDYAYYSEKVRKAKYDLDMDILKPYLQLDNIRTAMLWTADKLYGLKFEKLEGIPVYHKDVTVYKVSRDGKEVGLWYFDPYARPGKQSGAWMNAYREQHKYDKVPQTTIVSNNSNFIPGKQGEPTLLSWEDSETMFHEFGHALHGLNSNVNYPSLSGTSTARDFVEFPSQFHENYLSTPEVLKFLTNKDGKPIPQELITKIEKAKTFNAGFTSISFLSSAIVDMKLHLAGDKKLDMRQFEKDTLSELGMPKEITMRHRIPQFGHIFSGEGYAAGYYGYLWADVLQHDAFEAFTEAKGPYDKAVTKRFQDNILSVGNSIDQGEAYRKFRGRDPKADALLRARGFPTGDTKSL